MPSPAHLIDLGFTPAAALRAATEVNARFIGGGDRIGVLEPGRAADFALSNWTDLYTQARVQELRGRRPDLAAAE